MAAVFALVFLPALAAVGLMVKVSGSTLTFGAVFATACFAAMAAGVFYGLLRMAHHWETE